MSLFILIFGTVNMSNNQQQLLHLDEPIKGVARLRFNRPDVLNAINNEMAEELVQIYSDLAVRSDVLCLILTGTGRAFCVGADLKERSTMSTDELRRQHLVHRLAFTIRRSFEFPVIAAVNGIAHGGGAEIALGADILYAVQNASFRLPEVHRGIMPGMGGTQFLSRAVGSKVALQLLIDGTEVSAEEGYTKGFVNRIVVDGSLEEHVLNLAHNISRAPPLSVRAVTRSIRDGSGTNLESGLELELALHQRLMASDDAKEGFTAFAEKRDPNWSGS